ncbi:ComEA family DNA-binding protein [Neobacillus sp. GCM10023253]|uniref:ComEA family DNA-binding protein n=1 Tax=Neobacillus sp. GCM10023253 TaxID=3252644 RepID=UPI0036231739
MAKVYTDRGRKWEMLNSWWIIFTFLPIGMTSYIAFFYAGTKVKNKRWRIYGLVYLAIFLLAFIPTYTEFEAMIFLALWIVPIIHAFKIRPAYLVQLDVLKANEKLYLDQEVTKLRREAEAKFGKTQKPPQPKSEARANQQEASAAPMTPPIQPLFSNDQGIRKININLASEKEIATIPEVGIILAKKAVLKREELGGFESFEQFAQIMGLKEHTLEKMKQRLIFSETDHTDTHIHSGRVIDY